jgi:DNA replication protein DnaC
MQTTTETTNSVMDVFSKLISDAPEASDSQAAPKTAGKAYYVRETSGWGNHYITEIELKGEEWLKSFESAKPVVASGGLLVLVGLRGPGKTQMAAEIARSGNWPEDKTEYSRADGLIIHRHRTAIYRRAMDIFLDLREASKNHVKSSEKEVLAKLSDCGLLVIDEFQERGETEWENRVIKNLIDKRYASGRPTIIIANLTRKQIFEALGDSIVDRARENGKSIEFNWPSYRQQ